MWRDSARRYPVGGLALAKMVVRIAIASALRYHV